MIPFNPNIPHNMHNSRQKDLLSQRAPSPRALKEQVIRGFSRFFTQATHRNNATSSNSHIVIGGQFFISQPPHDKSSRGGDKFVPNQIAPLN